MIWKMTELSRDPRVILKKVCWQSSHFPKLNYEIGQITIIIGETSNSLFLSNRGACNTGCGGVVGEFWKLPNDPFG